VTTSICCHRHFNCEPSCTGGICFVELRNGRHLLVVSQGSCHLRQKACKPFDIKGYRFNLVTDRLQQCGGFPPIDQTSSYNLADIRLFIIRTGDYHPSFNGTELPCHA
jgi:hypothetical protein